jgi:hypothetical protein
LWLASCLALIFFALSSCLILPGLVLNKNNLLRDHSQREGPIRYKMSEKVSDSFVVWSVLSCLVSFV